MKIDAFSRHFNQLGVYFVADWHDDRPGLGVRATNGVVDFLFTANSFTELFDRLSEFSIKKRKQSRRASTTAPCFGAMIHYDSGNRSRDYRVLKRLAA